MADNPDTWTQADAIKLREFILQNPKFLRALAKHRPKISGETMEERAVTGSDMNGFLVALDAIETMQLDPDANAENPGFIDNRQSVE